jgi:hypothetical protein
MVQNLLVISKYGPTFYVKFGEEVVDGESVIRIGASIPNYDFTIVNDPDILYAISLKKPESRFGSNSKFKGDDLLTEDERNVTIALRNAGLNLAMRRALFAYPFSKKEYSYPALYRDGSIGEFSPNKKSADYYVAITWSTDIPDAGQTIGVFDSVNKAIGGIINYIKDTDTQGGLDEPSISSATYVKIRNDLRACYNTKICICDCEDFYRIQRIKS